MRVTDSGRRKSLVKRIRANQAQLQDAIEDISSGKDVRKPSDDPVASAMAERLRQASEQHRNFMETGQRMRDQFEAADDALGGVTDSLQSAKEIAIQFANEPSPGPEEAKAAAKKIKSIKEQVLESANAQHRGKHLFAGTDDDNQAFVKKTSGTWDGSGGSPQSYEYNGGDDTRSVKVNYQTEVEQISGDKVFAGSGQPGRNVFDALSAMEKNLKNNNTDGVRDRIEELDNSMQRVSSARQKLGYQIETIDHSKNFAESIVLRNTENKKNLEATDIAEASSRIQSASNALQATTTVAGQIQQASQSFLKLA